MQTSNKLALILAGASLILLVSCTAGASNQQVSYASVIVPTFDYQPGNKTATTVTIGGGSPIIAEIDTGSEITVVNESSVGPNLIKTTESLQVIYGAGTNTVSGYLAYGRVTFTTSQGAIIATDTNTPILVVTQGSVDQGGGNNAILGMRMNNQVSSRLFLPYPYNQMMLMNRSNNFLLFGNLTQEQLSRFATIPQYAVKCDNLLNNVNAQSNQCWNTPESAVTYHYSTTGSSFAESDYFTIFDSGEALGNVYLPQQPSWMDLNDKNEVLNEINATLNTNHGKLNLPLTLPFHYKQPESGSSGAINPGNLLFNTYQVLFNQQGGSIGFLESNESI